MKIALRLVASVLVTIFMIIVPVKSYEYLNSDGITEEMYRRREKYFYGVITLWQIDSFEGGTGSRSSWLKEAVKSFERKNNGVYVNVEAVSVEMAERFLESGQRMPDMISYGAGLNVKREMLQALSVDTSEHIAKDVIFPEAIPWCMGAYFMIGDGDSSLWGTDGRIVTSKKSSKTVYSVGVAVQSGHSSPYVLEKLCQNSFSGDTAYVTGSGQEMFERYNYTYTANRMLGTQRDVYRLDSCRKKEKARSGAVTFLGYSDLFQYVSVLKCDNEKKLKTMNDLCAFLCDKAQQDKLGSIGMLPINKAAEPQYAVNEMELCWGEIRKNGIKSSTYLFDASRAAAVNEDCFEKMQNRG